MCGRRQRNRVFAHIRAQIDTDDPNDKLKRIHEIRSAGFGGAPVLPRPRLDHQTAFEVEAALIDAYPGLINIVAARLAVHDFAAMHAQEIVGQVSGRTRCLSASHHYHYG